MAIWKLHGDGTLKPGAVVAPDERLSWGKTIGLGTQHVVAMFGATFVFPLLMGLNPQLAVMMSGIATLIFLAVVRGRVPSYLGSSASFVGVSTAIYAAGGNPSHVSGAMFWVGVLLLIAGIIIHSAGARVIHRALPPVVTGAVVMLIGFNLAPVVAKTYWPQDQWVALFTMLVVVVLSVGVRGFVSRIAIFVSLIVGYVLSWLLDVFTGPITSFSPAAGEATTHLRVDWSGVASAPWIGLPPVSDLGTWTLHGAGNVVGFHLPSFNVAFALIAMPVVIALIAENIGVMAATRIYSSAAYVVAALVAIGFGFSPKFGAVISATPGGVLGGITVVLYGMIGLLGAKIWKENQIDFGNPVNLVPVSAGIIIGVGDVSLTIGDFSLGGIAFGTIVTVAVYHLAHRLAPAELKRDLEGAVLIVDRPGAYRDPDADDR